jgi:hypothetical protein
VSLFLVFVLPVCWSTAMTQAWVERGQGASSNNTNEEREEREIVEEGDVARHSDRPPSEPRHVEVPRAKPRPVHVTPTIVASVAPKPHPLQLSARRQQ